MGERLRCVKTEYMGSLDMKDGRQFQGLRTVCDRPMGHRGDHKGRLFVASTVYGILSWREAVK